MPSTVYSNRPFQKQQPGRRSHGRARRCAPFLTDLLIENRGAETLLRQGWWGLGGQGGTELSRDERAWASVKFEQVLPAPLCGAAAGNHAHCCIGKVCCLLLVRANYIGRAPGRGPEGMGNCSSCYGSEPEAGTAEGFLLGVTAVSLSLGVKSCQSEPSSNQPS